ncbi:hypothetical protein BFP97_10085 [Roseivirga sp. 4D4]|uniref:MotA/TolQ/ExbB proton channel family protein n=1 Tax=Roseivirga sp. 4D4 TaxID=1889784 RepID=UPI0008539112|nr:MotA/TolQ/ExbB proton channel family protein [Roseivirga sp. 4D4]OEK01841.1 hypothetical protein BFP97_10085 [Roseivirga sp. 4D4]
MLDLINEGGPFFMGLLSIIGAGMIALAIFNTYSIFKTSESQKANTKIVQVREIGLLALVMGVLGTTVNLLGAFQAIEAAGDVSMSLLAGGLKYSTYTIIYGMIIYILSLLISIGLRWRVSKISA